MGGWERGREGRREGGREGGRESSLHILWWATESGYLRLIRSFSGKCSLAFGTEGADLLGAVLRILRTGLRVRELGFRVKGLGFRVQGLGFVVSG